MHSSKGDVRPMMRTGGSGTEDFDDSTVAGVTSRKGSRVSRWASRSFMVALLLICIAGGFGLLGGHTSRAVGAGGGYDLFLSYPGTSRPGLDTLWELKVVHKGGFKGQITVAVTASYFDLFETQGFYPTPAETTRDDSYVYMKFTPPPHGDTFTVMFDAYLQPYVAPTNLLANDATVMLVNHGKQVASIDYTTFVFP
jgi:hypothetical protein